MMCAACAARIEKNLKRAEGVADASVNYGNESATVTFDPGRTNRGSLAEVVRDSGYEVREAPPADSAATPQDWEQQERAQELRALQHRLAVALIFGVPVA